MYHNHTFYNVGISKHLFAYFAYLKICIVWWSN